MACERVTICNGVSNRVRCYQMQETGTSARISARSAVGRGQCLPFVVWFIVSCTHTLKCRTINTLHSQRYTWLVALRRLLSCPYPTCQSSLISTSVDNLPTILCSYLIGGIRSHNFIATSCLCSPLLHAHIWCFL